LLQGLFVPGFFGDFLAINGYFRFPERAVVSMEFMMQYFPDNRVWVFSGMVAERAVMTDGGHYFFGKT